MIRIPDIFNKFSVGEKVMMVILVEIVSYTAVTILALSQISSVGNEVKKMADLYLPMVSSTEKVRQQILEMRLNLKEIVFVGDRVVYDKDAGERFRSQRKEYLEKYSQIERELDDAEKLLALHKQDEHTLYNITDSKSYNKLASNQALLLIQLDNVREMNRNHRDLVKKLFYQVEVGAFLMGMEMLNEISASEAKLNSQVDMLFFILMDVKAASLEFSKAAEKRGSYITVIGSLFTIFVVIAIFFFVVRRNITRPFYVLTESIDTFDVYTKSLETPAEKRLINRGDEIGEVARSFNNLKHVVWNQRKDLESAKLDAEKANRAKSHFLAAASHDLRQPMHAMQMFIAALKERTNDLDSLKIISNIDDVSVSSAKLLNSLLDISHLEAGDVVPKFEYVPIREVFLRVKRSFSMLAEKKGLSLHIVDSSMLVYSDPILLERIIQNLVSNSIRFTKFGKVLIGCKRRGDDICIEVWDTGVGIPEDQSEDIYNEFHQLNNDERDRSRGIGLGLAIVKKLSECLGHKIEHSSVVGVGSKFLVKVKYNSEHKTVLKNSLDISPIEDCEQYVDLKNVRVLIIEDDQQVLDSTAKLLRSWGIIVHCAINKKQALEFVSSKEQNPEFIITDLRLPGGSDGVDIIIKIQDLLGEFIPSMIITGDVETRQDEAIADLGFKVLRKPVRPAKLRSLLTYLLSEYRRESLR